MLCFFFFVIAAAFVATKITYSIGCAIHRECRPEDRPVATPHFVYHCFRPEYVLNIKQKENRNKKGPLGNASVHLLVIYTLGCDF